MSQTFKSMYYFHMVTMVTIQGFMIGQGYSQWGGADCPPQNSKKLAGERKQLRKGKKERKEEREGEGRERRKSERKKNRK